jgi:hypothetical protein
MHELFKRLSADELISILYAVAVRLALRGLLTIVDVATIKAATDDLPRETDRAA